MARRTGWAWCLLASLIPGTASGTAIEWAAYMPRQSAPISNGTGFDKALEMRDGDFVLAGRDVDRRLLLRMDSRGAMRWMRDDASDALTAGAYTYDSLRETPKGLVVLGRFPMAGNPGRHETNAVLYDPSGKAIHKLSLGWGAHAFKEDGDIWIVDEELDENEPGYSPRLRVQLRGFESGIRWNTPLGAYKNDDVVAIQDRGMGNPVVVCVPRLPGDRDTVAVWALTAEGGIEWSAKFPTLPKVYPSEAHPTVEWNHITRLAGGRIVIAGCRKELTAAAVPGTESLILLGIEPDGKRAWMREVSIVRAALPGEWGRMSVSDLHPTRNGFRARVSRVYETKSWRIMEFDAEGNPSALIASTPEGRNPETLIDAGMDHQGRFVGWGWSQDSLTYGRTENGQPAPIAIGYPSLFATDAPVASGWNRIRLDAFRDTVFYTVHFGSRNGTVSTTTPMPGLGFFLPTEDGGALVGGGLWKRDADGVRRVAAIKLAPGYATGIASRRGKVRPSWGGFQSDRVFDMLGRARKEENGPREGVPVPRRR